MTESQQPEISLKDSSYRNAAILAIFALVSVSLTTLTWVLTKEKIQTEKELALLRAINELIPADSFANDPYSDCIIISDDKLLGTTEPQKAWRLRAESGQPVGIVLSSVAPNGYTGPIEFIAGYKITDNENSLVGVRVTSHQETPGLGDKIDHQKSDWIFSLNDHPVKTIHEPQWQVKKDGGTFDGFTGATITPRAILKAVTNTTEFYRSNQAYLFNTVSNCATTEEKSNE